MTQFIMKVKYNTSEVKILQSALYQTNSTVVVTDDLVLVVDPTWLPMEVASIRHFVQSIKGERPVYLLFTHSDYDHIIGYRAFMGEAKTIASQAFVDNPDKAAQEKAMYDFYDTYYISPIYKTAYPEIDIVIKEQGTVLTIGKTKLTFYLTPGHTEDSLMLVVDNLGLLVAGDYLSNVEFPFIYHDSRAYETTLTEVEKIIEKHDIQLLVPGHGCFTEYKTIMTERIQESRGYIRDLRHTLKTGEHFDLKRYLTPYPHRAALREEHDNNVKLMRKELNIFVVPPKIV